ncbi:hypothetical protein [Apibacter muscae]|nr:hypothetical protein [Apibacter muscae]
MAHPSSFATTSSAPKVASAVAYWLCSQAGACAPRGRTTHVKK